jgi:ppGpp synthetase/RelA/SpoT-type nucleotidyltranferase
VGDDMAWAIPQYSKKEVDNAGEFLAHMKDHMPDTKDDWSEFIEQMQEMFTVIGNWRSIHSFPLNTFQNGLRKKAKHIDPESLIAQRIKRLSSIGAKLVRFPSMQLSQMQDIGGCRAIVPSVAQVRELAFLYKSTQFKHKLVRFDDYIEMPKTSGYRGVHLVYRYNSDRKETYNGLKIEVQIRSKLQHAWATAVETIGTFVKQALKSSQGEEDWLRFFALMGSAIAFRERTFMVPHTPGKAELKRELARYVTKLNVEGHLHTYGAALKTLENSTAGDAHYFLLKLDPNAQLTTVTGYKFNELERASKDYLDVEQEIVGQPGADAVLVAVESVNALRRAYPNYFLDTHVFIAAVKQAIEQGPN